MKRYFLMDCSDILDIIYELDEYISLPFLTYIRIELHLLLCPQCSSKLKEIRHIEEIMKTDFLPSAAPGLEIAVMERIYSEAERFDLSREDISPPAWFSFRGWVIIGFLILISLSSSFFGMNFIEIANREGLSFLLPVGITIGIVVTCYGALFIGSHLKELSNRFGLH